MARPRKPRISKQELIVKIRANAMALDKLSTKKGFFSSFLRVSEDDILERANSLLSLAHFLEEAVIEK